MVLFDVVNCPSGGFFLRLDQIGSEIELHGGSNVKSDSFAESKFILPHKSPFFEKDRFQIKIKEPSPFYYFAHFSHEITPDIRSNPVIVKLIISWSHEDWENAKFENKIPVAQGERWSIWQTDGYISRKTLFDS